MRSGHGRVSPHGDYYLRSRATDVARIPDYMQSTQPTGPTARSVGRTMLEGKISSDPRCLADPELHVHGAAEVGGYRTMLGVPLLREGVPIGVIVL